MAPAPCLALLAASVLPSGLQALNSLHAPQLAQRHSGGDGGAVIGAADWVSPIAGCQGFECVLQYIALPDDAYAWHDTKVRLHGQAGGNKHGLSNVSWTGYVLNMTSQQWRTGAHVEHPTWWHNLVVIIPETLEFKDWATLTLDFGVNDGKGRVTRVDNRETDDMVQVAEQASISINSGNLLEELPELRRAVWKAAFLAARTRAPAASLLNLPNAFETFGSDPLAVHRSADFLKAFTYKDFLDHPEQPERIMELPVAKAVVRAMDTVQAYTAALPSGAVSRFGVTGYSKLGTATWVAAAADSRVKAIVPIAIYLSFNPADQTETHSASPVTAVTTVVKKAARAIRQSTYDVQSEDMGMEYAGVMASVPTPEYDKLSSIIDPWRFMDRLALPKLIVMGSKDFVVGASHLKYLPDSLVQLPGTTAFLEVPNCLHDDSLVKSLGPSSAFFRGFLLGLTPPALTSAWDPALQTISVTQVGNTQVRPVSVMRWDRSQPLMQVDTAVELQSLGPSNLTWSSAVPTQPEAPLTSFIEMEFEWPEPGQRYRVSSPVYPLELLR